MRRTATHPQRKTARQTELDLRRARNAVRHWSAWFVPPTILLVAVLWIRLDYRFVAVCLLGFPLIMIRLVAAWSDYQQLRAAAAEAAAAAAEQPPDSAPVVA